MLKEAIPSSEFIQGTICDLCAKILDVATAEPCYSFIGLGGDSIAAMKLVGRIADTFGVEVDIQQVFDAPSLDALGHDVMALVQCKR